MSFDDWWTYMVKSVEVHLLLSTEKRNNRIDICKQCDKLVKKHCVLCDCYMPLKTWISIADCPENKWEKE
jgi:Family of unknown function (DUF6171)